MKQIITFANTVIDACLKCELRPVCEWFEGASHVILDNVNPDQYARMSYEQIAYHIHADVGSPTEDCEQLSFDDMMNKVGDLLSAADIPFTTKELLALLRKIYQLKCRLNRLPSDCRSVFDAPVRAIIDRTLAELDYQYLAIGLDIIEIIQDNNSQYDREKLLFRDYLPRVVRALIAKAYKLSAEEAVAYKGNYKDYPIPKQSTGKTTIAKEAKQQVIPDNLLEAKPYLDALKKNGYLDNNYRWTHKEGSTNYHAGWASKIIVHNCPGVTHQRISQLIGVSSLSSYVTLAKTKTTIVQLIAKLFAAEGLSTTAE